MRHRLRMIHTTRTAANLDTDRGQNDGARRSVPARSRRFGSPRLGRGALIAGLTVASGALAMGPATAAAPATSAVSAQAAQNAAVSAAASDRTRKVIISGGHATKASDNGRPVKLIAAALGVPTQVFRDAFSRVTPTPDGSDPSGEQARANKEILLATLAPYGVSNEQLDTVSDYYRYFGGGLWAHETAEVKAVVRRGEVRRFRIINAGAGYSSSPKIKVRGFPNLKVKAKVSYGTDLATNGSIVKLKVKNAG